MILILLNRPKMFCRKPFSNRTKSEKHGFCTGRFFASTKLPNRFSKITVVLRFEAALISPSAKAF
ncbi:hypothetical protein B9Q13_01335 [Candidatus Marsarchaeota G2 archaeon ECH_B_SAG-G16]|uniref:Uncharacterized protein n=1 Tax=Candidatus Marsarchaeota G2 archaeon ECH_B_SAG-G16 TaxID=1978167 RepID=A0A2R6C4A2_9ARCH|nr:MAG: hypothetical protein B9Q13_01335 [Candidatus Marsarchaeota G2 archaeon ECH_B_SAG-G16]